MCEQILKDSVLIQFRYKFSELLTNIEEQVLNSNPKNSTNKIRLSLSVELQLLSQHSIYKYKQENKPKIMKNSSNIKFLKILLTKLLQPLEDKK